MTDTSSHPEGERRATAPPPPTTHTRLFVTLLLWRGDKRGERSPPEVWRPARVCAALSARVCVRQVCGGPERRHGDVWRCELSTPKHHMELQDLLTHQPCSLCRLLPQPWAGPPEEEHLPSRSAAGQDALGVGGGHGGWCWCSRSWERRAPRKRSPTALLLGPNELLGGGGGTLCCLSGSNQIMWLPAGATAFQSTSERAGAGARSSCQITIISFHF